MTPIENQHCNRQNCLTQDLEPCELGQIEIYQNGEKIGTNSVCLKLYDVDVGLDEFHFQSQGSTDSESLPLSFDSPCNPAKC